LKERFIKKSVFLYLITLVTIISTSLLVSAAEKWPSRPITIVVPFGAGGGADTSARALAKHWERELGVKLLVVNRPGANAQVGTSYFLDQPADGNTVLLGAQMFYSSNIVLQNASYGIDDISLLSFLELDHDCMSVPATSPYQTFEDLNKAILSNPGKIRVARSPASPSAILVDALIDKFKWDIKTVSYVRP